MTTHALKTDTKYFAEVEEGTKRFEIRKYDRDFQIHDTLILRETVYSGKEMAAGSDLAYTGEQIDVRVLGIMHGPIYGLEDGWCIMSIEVIETPF